MASKATHTQAHLSGTHLSDYLGHPRLHRSYGSGPDVALARSDAKGQGGSGGKPRTSRTGPNERL